MSKNIKQGGDFRPVDFPTIVETILTVFCLFLLGGTFSVTMLFMIARGQI